MSAENAPAELTRICERVETCTRCDLHITANRGVPGEGPGDADIMLVGEAPGFNEDKQGRPFVGAAGKFLEELLSIAGLQRSQVYVTNVVKHRPPDNRPPRPDELQACRAYLDSQIAVINPRLIITLGRFSLEAFFPPSGPGAGISRVHGQIRERDNRYFFHSYHPAAALHKQELRQTLLDDMKTLAVFIQGPFTQTRQQSTRDDASDEEPPQQLSLF